MAPGSRIPRIVLLGLLVLAVPATVALGVVLLLRDDAPTAAGPGSALPLVAGRPEGCLQCHAAMTGFAPAHNPSAIGCAACHAGNPLTLDKAAAHRAMVLIPGNLADASRSCGTAQCHPEAVPRVTSSLMASMAGVVAVNRTVFGEPAPTGAAGHVQALQHSPADSHLRQLCASCHLGTAKLTFGPMGEDARGGGCNACHLVYSRAADDAWQRYAQSAGQANREAPAVHPQLSASTRRDACFGCHSRSGRISTNYEGWMETSRSSPDPAAPARYRTLADGRVFEKVQPDVHAARLECIDCHTAREVMGDGQSHTRKADAIEIACVDCHLAGPPRTMAPSDVDAESQRLLSLRQQTITGRFLTASRTGLPLVNAFVGADGRAVMTLKRTGAELPLKPPAAVCVQGGGHERLSCGSCHTAWAPRCSSCHTAFDAAGRGVDLLTDADTAGDWVETAGPFRAALPTLGMRRVTRANAPATDVVETFIPGMIMRLAVPGRPVTFHRLYAASAPHTIAKAARSCVSCHADPEALGYGRGTLTYARRGDRGDWTFRAAEPPSPEDGLPADAWIPFLGTRTGRVSTRDDVRPFTVAEQRAMLAVGACLTCHSGDSPVMRSALADWRATRARVTPRCLLPFPDGAPYR